MEECEPGCAAKEFQGQKAGHVETESGQASHTELVKAGNKVI